MSECICAGCRRDCCPPEIRVSLGQEWIYFCSALCRKYWQDCDHPGTEICDKCLALNPNAKQDMVMHSIMQSQVDYCATCGVRLTPIVFWDLLRGKIFCSRACRGDAEPAPAHDPVNRPAHYTSHPSGVECITITRHHNFNIGNVIKYCWRAGLKGGGVSNIEDLKKAQWYLADEIRRLEK